MRRSRHQPQRERHGRELAARPVDTSFFAMRVRKKRQRELRFGGEPHGRFCSRCQGAGACPVRPGIPYPVVPIAENRRIASGAGQNASAGGLADDLPGTRSQARPARGRWSSRDRLLASATRNFRASASHRGTRPLRPARVCRRRQLRFRRRCLRFLRFDAQFYFRGNAGRSVRRHRRISLDANPSLAASASGPSGGEFKCAAWRFACRATAARRGRGYAGRCGCSRPSRRGASVRACGSPPRARR